MVQQGLHLKDGSFDWRVLWPGRSSCTVVQEAVASAFPTLTLTLTPITLARTYPILTLALTLALVLALQ